MKNITLLTWLLAFATQVIFAQTSNNIDPVTAQVSESPSAQAKEATDKMNNIIRLSANQYSQVLESYKDYYAKEAQIERITPAGKGVGSEKGSSNKGYSSSTADPNFPTRGKITSELKGKIKSILSSGQWKKAEDAGLVGEKGTK